MKIVIVFPAFAAVIHLLVLICVFPMKTPNFLCCCGNIKESERVLNMIYTPELARNKSFELQESLKI